MMSEVAGDYYASNACAVRNDHVEGNTIPVPITNATSQAFCPNGWVPPPEGGADPRPPPDVDCPSLPCQWPTNTTYTNGSGLWLFDIEADETETTDLAAKYPEVVQQLVSACPTDANT